MTNSEQRRLTHWRLRLLHAASDAGNVAWTCRHFGISRKTFYKWRRRYNEHGDVGLADRARAPHHSPRATPREVVGKILYLRQHYHFGPGEDCRLPEAVSQPLDRLCLRPSHSVQARHEPPPGEPKISAACTPLDSLREGAAGPSLQVDVKFLERIPGTRRRFYQFTAIDDCTRIRVLKVYDACNQRTATEFIDDVLRRLPFRVHVIQTDNGAEFQSHFHWHLED